MMPCECDLARRIVGLTADRVAPLKTRIEIGELLEHDVWIVVCRSSGISRAILFSPRFGKVNLVDRPIHVPLRALAMSDIAVEVGDGFEDGVEGGLNLSGMGRNLKINNSSAG